MSEASTTWPLQAARDQLSQLVKAAADGPQTVTVHGRPAAVVLSPAAYGRLKRAQRGSLSSALLQPGLLQPGLLGAADEPLFERPRDRAKHRDIAL